MPQQDYDVVGIGNAIVDVIARADDDFLVAEGLAKGTMRLIDGAEAERLYAAMGPAVEVSGGSAANTIAGLASFGARTAFIGKVADDGLGAVFAHDIRAQGVAYATGMLDGGVGTGRCLVLVTPDGERTMNTYLGASHELGPEDVPEEVIAGARFLYLEGYLWDPPAAKAAMARAAEIAQAAGRTVALSLSDAFCVDRFRPEFLELVRSGAVDILFGNEAEVRALYETADTDAALAALAADCGHAVVTRSEQGAVILKDNSSIAVPAAPVERVVDLTGAGDLFAAGFLFGLARSCDAATAARLGAMAAAEVISHLGARPQANLKDLAVQAGLPA